METEPDWHAIGGMGDGGRIFTGQQKEIKTLIVCQLSGVEFNQLRIGGMKMP
jgi:hypothetical protein